MDLAAVEKNQAERLPLLERFASEERSMRRGGAGGFGTG